MVDVARIAGDKGWKRSAADAEEDAMDLGLEGRNAIVTGGSLGIGTAVAIALARERK